MSTAFILALPSLINAGVASVQQVRTLIASLHPGMTESEVDAVLGLIVADATRRKALADADQQPNP